MERHTAKEHAGRSEPGYKQLSRDQVVDLMTAAASASGADFKCFYCEDGVVGDIRELKAHFDAAHAAETFKVKSFAALAASAAKRKGATSGYLECQLCGHLTAGFERSSQGRRRCQ